jgi:hypothetical protein
MNLDKLAAITQNEFLAVRKDMDKGFVELRGDMQELRGDMQELRGDMQELRGDMQEGFSTMRKDIMEEVGDIVREGNIKIIASNEKVALKLDGFLEDRAAHDSLHKRITDDLHYHDQRIKKLEAKV